MTTKLIVKWVIWGVYIIYSDSFDWEGKLIVLVNVLKTVYDIWSSNITCGVIWYKLPNTQFGANFNFKIHFRYSDVMKTSLRIRSLIFCSELSKQSWLETRDLDFLSAVLYNMRRDTNIKLTLLYTGYNVIAR